MLSQQTIDFLIARHKNKISLGELLDLYKLKYPNVSYTRVAIKLFDDLKIKYEPEYLYKDDIWIKNPAYNKDYGFNSYFIVEYEQRFLLDDFTTDNGGMVANALNYMINDISYELVSNLEEDLNCSANNFLGAYSDVFVDTVQLSEKFNISVLKEYKEQTAQNKNLSKPVIDSTELQEEKAKNAQLQAEIERFKAENTELKAQLQDNAQRQSVVNSKPVLENAKAYDVRERETHLLIIGALSNLLAENKRKYQKGNGGINQSAISKDIETEIIDLLQPATKTRTIDTIRPRIRESLNLITKAE